MAYCAFPKVGFSFVNQLKCHLHTRQSRDEQTTILNNIVFFQGHDHDTQDKERNHGNDLYANY